MQKSFIKKLLPRTLLGRSLLILIIPILLIQVVTSYMFFERHWGKMTSRLSFAVAGEISTIANIMEDRHSYDEKALTLILWDYAQNLDLDVTLKTGEFYLESRAPKNLHGWEAMVAEKLAEELSQQLSYPFSINLDFQGKQIDVFVQLESGILNVSFPVRRIFSSSGYIFLLWMIGASLLLLVVAIMFMRNQVRPIRKLAVAAERFGRGRDVPEFKPTGAREVRQAAQAFLDMRTRIKRQVEQRTTMLAGVSHDLRTPLTRMKLQLEMLGGSGGSDDDIRAMKQDISEMEKMIEGYLDFVRGEGDEVALTLSINEILHKIIAASQRQGRQIHESLGEETKLVMRPMALERALVNVIENAAKHGQNIWVSMRQEADQVEITIEDDGPGISEEHYEEVFRPFYRVETSRNKKTGGVGLGLPIAMDIIHNHGGSIELAKSTHGGLKAVIYLPI